MYQQHFQLTRYPFGLTPDTQFFCELPTHTEALNVLWVALSQQAGIIKITGDVGTGKTLLCRKLLNELPEPFQAAYIPNPHLTPEGLHLAIADELGIEVKRHIKQSRLLHLINEHLIHIANAGKKLVLIIDEAQAMSLETLETLRLLTNLETEQQKLLQIVLFGQPELDQKLQNKTIRQFRQRITFSYHLSALNCAETTRYIQHRLRVSGQPYAVLFTKSARLAMRFYSRGIPRLINVMAHKAMLSAYGKGSASVGLIHVYLAAMDTEDVDCRLHKFSFHKGYAIGLLVSAISFLWPSMVERL